ncbi:MAG: cytochrome c [Terracidiphilus sp.]|jgi:mono/diheme cytochrome c family protein
MTLRIRVAAVILLATSIANTAFAQARGADAYKAKCARCHGDDGLATTPVAKRTGIESFKSPEMMKWSDGQFIAFTKKTYTDHGPTDAQIKDIVAYIRKLQKQ